jgi:putative hemolysin
VSGLLVAVGVILLLIFINAFLNATEIATVSVRRARIKQLADDGNTSARRLQKLLNNPRAFIATVQIGVTLAGFFASAFGADNLAPVAREALQGDPFNLAPGTAETVAFIGVTIIVAFVTLILGELVPKTLGIERAEPIALRMSGFVTVLARFTWPLVAFLTGTTTLIVRLLGGRRKGDIPSITEEEIISMIETGGSEGVVTESEEEMIRNIFDFTDRRASDVMVPRPDMFELPEDMTIAEAAPAMRSTGHSRVPIYHGDRENITGMVVVKDVLGAYVEGQTDQRLKEISRAVAFVPETKRIGDLLRELQRNRQYLAIAVDEFGGVSGMLTLEDLLEEIVGEIQDELEPEEAPLQRIAPNELLVAGNILIGTILDALDLRIRDVDEDSTVAALILEIRDSIPDAGDQVHWHDLTFTVEEMSRHRIQKVRVRLDTPAEDAVAEEDRTHAAPAE